MLPQPPLPPPGLEERYRALRKRQALNSRISDLLSSIDRVPWESESKREVTLLRERIEFIKRSAEEAEREAELEALDRMLCGEEDYAKELTDRDEELYEKKVKEAHASARAMCVEVLGYSDEEAEAILCHIINKEGVDEGLSLSERWLGEVRDAELGGLVETSVYAEGGDEKGAKIRLRRELFDRLRGGAEVHEAIESIARRLERSYWAEYARRRLRSMRVRDGMIEYVLGRMTIQSREDADFVVRLVKKNRRSMRKLSRAVDIWETPSVERARTSLLRQRVVTCPRCHAPWMRRSR